MERFQQERPHQVPRCAAGTRPGPTPCKADHRHLALEQSIPAPNAPHLALITRTPRAARGAREGPKSSRRGPHRVSLSRELQLAWNVLTPGLGSGRQKGHSRCAESSTFLTAGRLPACPCRHNTHDRWADRGPQAALSTCWPLSVPCPLEPSSPSVEERASSAPLPAQGGSARLWTMVGKSPRPAQQHQVTHTCSF